MKQEPSIDEIIKQFGSAIRGEKDGYADVRRGSVYEYIGGAAAMIWSREAQRDTDLFAATRFKNATGDELTAMGFERYGIPRVLDTYGTGTVLLSRPSAAAGGGTFWRGTRFRASGEAADSAYYEVTEDTVIPSGLSAILPIRACVIGSHGAIDVTSVLLDDPVWDNSWTALRLVCSDGTDFEPADAYRARIRSTRLDQRVGQENVIIAACEAQGATNVVLFRSNYAGDDFDYGYNYCYVSDNGYTATADLIKRCKVALDAVRVLGDNLQVLGMYPIQTRVQATLTLSDRNVDLERVKQLAVGTVLQYFAGNPYAFQISAIAGRMYRSIPVLQDAAILVQGSSVDSAPTTTIAGIPTFPALLYRYIVTPNSVVVNYG